MIPASGPAKPHPVKAGAHDQRCAGLNRTRLVGYAASGLGSAGRLTPASLGIPDVASGNAPA